LVGSLSANLQRFGMERVAQSELLQEIMAEMTDSDGTGENPDQRPWAKESGRLIYDKRVIASTAFVKACI